MHFHTLFSTVLAFGVTLSLGAPVVNEGLMKREPEAEANPLPDIQGWVTKREARGGRGGGGGARGSSGGGTTVRAGGAGAVGGGVVAAVDPDADDDYDNCSGIKDFFGICD